MNPDLYACLPPDKKEEYKKLFPNPDLKPDYHQNLTIDSLGDMWVWPGIIKDDRLHPGIGVLGKIKVFPEGKGCLYIDGMVLDLGVRDINYLRPIRHTINTCGHGSYEPGYLLQPSDGYIVNVHSDGSGSFIHPPQAQGASTARYSEYKKSQPEIGLSPGEHRIITWGTRF